MDEDKLRRTILRFHSLLSNQDYEGIEAFTHGRHMSGAQIRTEIENWPADCGQFVTPPSEQIENLVYIGPSDFIIPGSNPRQWQLGGEVPRSSPRRWNIDASLYTENEGKSDLTAKMCIIDNSDDLYTIELQDLDVM